LHEISFLFFQHPEQQEFFLSILTKASTLSGLNYFKSQNLSKTIGLKFLQKFEFFSVNLLCSTLAYPIKTALNQPICRFNKNFEFAIKIYSKLTTNLIVLLIYV
jgi:hypothetical protein